MAVAYIREYAAMGITANALAQAPLEPAMADQIITTGATAAASAAFGSQTTLVAVSTPAAQAVCVLFGSAPIAGVINLRLPSNSVFFFGVKPGDKVSLIDVT